MFYNIIGEIEWLQMKRLTRETTLIERVINEVRQVVLLLCEWKPSSLRVRTVDWCNSANGHYDEGATTRVSERYSSRRSNLPLYGVYSVFALGTQRPMGVSPLYPRQPTLHFLSPFRFSFDSTDMFPTPPPYISLHSQLSCKTDATACDVYRLLQCLHRGTGRIRRQYWLHNWEEDTLSVGHRRPTSHLCSSNMTE